MRRVRPAAKSQTPQATNKNPSITPSSISVAKDETFGKPSAVPQPRPQLSAGAKPKRFQSEDLRTLPAEQQETLIDFMHRLTSAYAVKRAIDESRKGSGWINTAVLREYPIESLFPPSDTERAAGKDALDKLARMGVLAASRTSYSISSEFRGSFRHVYDWYKQSAALPAPAEPARPAVDKPAAAIDSAPNHFNFS